MRRIVLVILLTVFSMSGAWAAAADIGVVLMHGKWGSPQWPGLSVVADAMTDKGYLVEALQMPWSRERMYDQDYPEALAEIDSTVAKLKARGARKIFIAGHSFGANAALAYASQRDGIAGIVLLAPGHSPDYQASVFAGSVSKARALVAEGKAEDIADFDDSNQGRSRTIQTRARVYLSYFDPGGLGAMSVTAPKVHPGTAVLLIIGRHDPWIGRAKTVIFDKTPADPRSRYLEINSTHKATPKDGLGELLSWLKTFE